MSFHKGQSGNPRGRPAGRQNQVTIQVRRSLEKASQEALEGLRADLAAMTPVDRLTALARLLPFIVPRMEAVEHSGTVNAGPIFGIFVSAETKTALETVIRRINEKGKGV